MVVLMSAGFGGDLTLRGGDSGNGNGTASPAAKEAARQRIAWEAGARFIADLKGLAGGAAENALFPDRDSDETVFDSQLREALAKEGFNYEEELSKLKRGTDEPEWMTKAEFFLAKMVRNVPDALKERVKEAFDGDDKEDFNTTACLSWAATYFGDYASDNGLVNMATILLDYAFVRQGIDDEYVAQIKASEPPALPPAEDTFGAEARSELQHLWDAAPDINVMFGNAPRVVGRVKPTKESKGVTVRGTGTFLHIVRSRSGAWKPKLARRIEAVSATSIHRVAMVNAGLASGDGAARTAMAGSRRFKSQQPNIFVTLGVAAMALELTDPQTETPYKLHTKFCRTCAGALPNWHGNGCCQMETFQGAGMDDTRPTAHSINDIMGYLDGDERKAAPMDGVKISHLPGEPWRVNVLPVWGPNRWQEVGSQQDAVELGNRVMREHQIAGSLTAALPKSLFPLPERGAVSRVIDDEDQLVVAAVENASVDRMVTDLAESSSQYRLGRNVKWAGLATCAMMLFWTANPMWLAFAGVAYVAGWALIDKKGIETKKQKLLAAAKEQKALPPG